MSNLAVIHNEIQTVNFHGHELALVAHNDEPHVAMRPVCDAIGLQWQSQYNRIKRHPVLAACVAVMNTQLPGDTQRRAVVILPLQYLNGWLFGIDASRVKPAIRERLIQYQRECFQALYDYWHRGVAINPRVTLTPAQQRALQELVAKRAAEIPAGVRRGAYAKLWGAVKTEFRVGTYKDLPASQFEEAKTFLERVVLEGEWTQAPSPAGELLPEAQAREIVERLTKLGQLFHPFSDQFGHVIGISRALRGLSPRLGVEKPEYRQVLARI